MKVSQARRAEERLFHEAAKELSWSLLSEVATGVHEGLETLADPMTRGCDHEGLR